jgi:alpha-tubulin suppressor-like RCC1 family protein
MGDSLPAIDLGTSRTAVAIAGGSNHTCAILDNASLKCWGLNSTGQLGLGDTADRGDNAGEMGDNLPAIDLGSGRSVVQVAPSSSPSFSHTCALLDNGSVKCWGYNSSGQLGLGDTVNRGDNAGEMGDNLPAVNLGAGRSAVSIAVGSIFSCALLDDGRVKCWGSNTNGYLGAGDTANRGDNADEMGDNLPAIDLGAGRTAVAIAAGPNHACAILDNASLKCWGFNSSGQLGQGDTNSRGDNVGEMGDNLPAVDLGN